MNVFRRSLFYISRKKGQTVVLFLLFSIVSVFLISCFSILDATDAVAKDLRTSVGGAFYLRPSPKLDFKDGEIAQNEGTPPLYRRMSSRKSWAAAISNTATP